MRFLRHRYMLAKQIGFESRRALSVALYEFPMRPTGQVNATVLVKCVSVDFRMRTAGQPAVHIDECKWIICSRDVKIVCEGVAMRRPIAYALLMVAVRSTASAQAPVSKPTFEVASVKQNTVNGPSDMRGPLRSGDLVVM